MCVVFCFYAFFNIKYSFVNHHLVMYLFAKYICI